VTKDARWTLLSHSSEPVQTLQLLRTPQLLRTAHFLRTAPPS
jgi:hypothetical protein